MVVQVNNVTKRYKQNRGVNQASFTLHNGEIIALVGANGAGKSTLIQLLIKQIKPDTGEIVWQDNEELRYMPDDLAFPEALTAEEILHLLGNLKKVSKERQHIILKEVGLFEAKELKVGQFSKGMRQRLNLAQSMMGEGSLFILDEPTNGLDPYWIAQLKKVLLHEKQNGQIVLFSTHLLSLAEEIADSVILLNDGEILATGTISSLLERENCTNLEQVWLKLTKKEGL
ncbi:ABC transporter ATP-binding protein [Domibacillus mangrovi]|uniref:ABC transporter ATP-binding protein n=1 Tax=Domibacillus mangrovi TaxID=1714354 RepID=A0A1Q5P3V4_9BACI|nr:ABC transporter ATP-binding protein [Domibacillus mangrovi]OKL36924.1 ABC transporter ATP-binding protein [Domibacillus mangrovi]